jgi:ABC-type glycerol-3-phosphate transport system substrate-binding protein
MTNSLTAFAAGKVAIYFGYSYDLPRILAASKGKINLGIAKMPQIQGGQDVNYANYWVETVSSQSQHKNEAWDFILFASDKKYVVSYLNKTKKPTALRALINSQLKDDQLNVFASQLLTSTNWYVGKDANQAEAAMKEMIEAVVNGEDPQQAMEFAANRIQQTVR